MVSVIAPPRGATSPSSLTTAASASPPLPLLLLLFTVGNLFAVAAAEGIGAKHEDAPREASSVDACDACAAAGYALHDALSYQQARLRATFGSDVSLADFDPTEVAAAVAAATGSACGARGFWERFRYKLVGGARSKPMLTLSGPGLDAHFVAGLERPDDDDTRLALAVELRARCAEEASRVGAQGLIHAFNASAHVVGVSGGGGSDVKNAASSSSTSRGGGAGDGDGAASDSAEAAAAESAAAFASMLCVEKELAKAFRPSSSTPHAKKSRAALKKIAKTSPCRLSATRDKARRLVDAVESAEEELAALTSNRTDMMTHANDCADDSGDGASAAAALDALSRSTSTKTALAALEEDPAQLAAARLCQSVARAALARGESLQRLADSPSVAGTPAARVHLRDARESYAVAEAVSRWGRKGGVGTRCWVRRKKKKKNPRACCGKSCSSRIL